MKKTRSFTNTILWAFILLNISSLMILTFSVKYEDGERARNSAETSLSEIVTEKAQLISKSLKSIEDKTENMADWMEFFLKGESDAKLSPSYISDDKTGVLKRKIPQNTRGEDYSAVFLPNDVPLTEQIEKELIQTEKLEPIFQKIREQEDLLKWVYVATERNMLRVFPYYDVSVFAGDHKQTSDTFYKIVDAKNNPKRTSAWTEPYVDYLGTGWTITSSHPIYDENDQFYGVMCADVGIEELRARFLEGFTLGESGKIYLLTDSGNIIYHSDYQVIAEKQGEMYDKNIFKDEELSPVKERIIREVLTADESFHEFTDWGQGKMIAGSRIQGQPWTIIIEIDSQEFLSQNRISGKVLLQLMFIGIMLAFILVIILYYEFSVPMRTLMDGVKTISHGEFERIRNNTGFSEINELSEAFNTMNDNLQKYTDRLLERNNEITTVLNTISGELVIIDLNRRITIANEKAEGKLCRLPEEYQNCHVIFEQSNQPCDNCVLLDILKNKQQVERQTVLDGEIYKRTYYPVMTEAGELREIIILNQCITKSIAMERELQQIEKMAGIGQFSAAIAHEIKNPLAVIKGAVYIMNMYNCEDNPAGAYTEEIETVTNAVREAERVITTLLDFSSKETETGSLVDLEKIIQQILMISRKEIIKMGLTVEVDVRLSEFFYGGKVESIKVILQNLINNSIQAVEENGTVKVTAYKSEAGTVRIDISDNGTGIPEELRDKVFKPFITTKKENGGTGIGLWISKTLVEGLDGKISINKEKVVGTEINVELPILTEAVQPFNQEVE